jgi:hypothetical protein
MEQSRIDEQGEQPQGEKDHWAGHKFDDRFDQGIQDTEDQSQSDVSDRVGILHHDAGHLNDGNIQRQPIDDHAKQEFTNSDTTKNIVNNTCCLIDA